MFIAELALFKLLTSLRLNTHISHFLGLKELILEEVGEVPNIALVLEGTQFIDQVAAFEADNAVGQGVALFLVDVLAHELRQFSKVHDGTGDHEVELSFFLNHVAVHGSDVLQADGLCHGGGHLYLLTDAVEEVETTFGEEYGKRNAGEAAARTHVHYGGTGTEADDFGDAQRVEHVVGIEIVDVLARNDVYLGVPVVIERVESSKLLALTFAEVGKVVVYELDGCIHVRNIMLVIQYLFDIFQFFFG